MEEFNFRDATINDIPFMVDTIIEAEKSGTNILTYQTIFGLTEDETRNYLEQMLLEKVDGCELSISSFLLAESNEKIAASICAWIEGEEGISSSILKGNLLNYMLPKTCIERAISLNWAVKDLHIDNEPNSIQIGLVYVSPEFRRRNLVSLLINEQVSRLKVKNNEIEEIQVQVFGNNIPAIKAYEKANFKIKIIKESTNKEIINVMPSDKKLLMIREL